MQASESLTARSLKAKLLVLRLGCTCSILIEPDASTCFRDPTQGWLVLALLGCGKLTHTHICKVGCAAYGNVLLLSSVRSSSMGPILGKRCYLQIVDSHRGILALARYTLGKTAMGRRKAADNGSQELSQLSTY